MLLSRQIFVSILSLFLLTAIGCRSNPVYNVNDAPINTEKPMKLAQVQKAIIRAGASLGWRMKPVKPGHIIGTLRLRTHTAVVNITYNAESYNITYKDSVNLDYDGQNIHKHYNSWVNNLSIAIDNKMLEM